jgi:D-3-phosphoglycerate dehydrogenase
MKKKILVCDGLAPEGIDVLKAAGAFDLTILDEPSHEELKRSITDANGLIVRSHSKVSADVIDAAPALQVIARAGTGLDNIDIDRATEKGIAVINTPVGNTTSAAEHTIALLFSLARKIPMADADMKARRWEKNLCQGIELRGKTIAVIGLGRIGSEVAARCRALSMRVVGYDPFISSQPAPGTEVEMLPLEEIWRQADFITVHTPLTDETKDLVNRDVIRRMKPDVRLINCARGGIYNEQDLYDALKTKRIAGAAIDVFTEEPPEHLPPFHELDNVVLTPHLGASTQEARISVAVEAAQVVAEYLTTGIARNSVNVPPTDQTEYEFLKPYINLAEKMGRLRGRLQAER